MISREYHFLNNQHIVLYIYIHVYIYIYIYIQIIVCLIVFIDLVEVLSKGLEMVRGIEIDPLKWEASGG